MKTQSASWYFTLALKVCGFNQGFSVKEKQKKKCLWTPGLKWFDHVQRRDWICWTQDVEHGSTRQEVKGKSAEEDMERVGVTEKKARDQARWRKMIFCR